MYTTTFGVWDYLVFGLMLVASICIGIYHAVRGKNQTTSEYLVAGRTMTFLPMALSLVATYNSSIMMLGTPAESYVYGFSWILSEFGSATGNILEIILVLVFLKRLDLSTPYEYFERRFKSRGLRLLTNVMTCINNLLYMSMVLYGQGIALQAVTGFPLYGTITVTAGAAVIYTTIGGLKAVIWTDVLQFLIMFTGLLMVAVKGTVDAGRTGEVWTRAAQSGRLDFSFDPDPTVRHTVWNLYFGRILTGFGFLIGPASLQRLSSTKSLTESRRALLLTVPGFAVLVGIALVDGIVAYGYYSYKRCDPLSSEQIETPNQIMPFMIMDLFRNLPGMPGLFLAALSSASLSTISSCLSAISIITWYDIFKPCWPNMSEFRGLMVAKITVVVFGILGCCMVLMIWLIGSRTLVQISYTTQAITRFPVVGLFYLGALFPFVNKKGAVTGFLSGIALTGWLVIGSMLTTGDHTSYSPLGPNDHCPAFNFSTSLVNTTTITHATPTTSQYDILGKLNHDTVPEEKSGLDLLYSLSYTLFSSMAMCLVLLIGTLASCVTGGWSNRADPELMIHMTDIQCWRLPRRLRRHNNDDKHHDARASEHGAIMDYSSAVNHRLILDVKSDGTTTERSTMT